VVHTRHVHPVVHTRHIHLVVYPYIHPGGIPVYTPWWVSFLYTLVGIPPVHPPVHPGMYTLVYTPVYTTSPGTPRTYTSPASARVLLEAGISAGRRSPGLNPRDN